MVSSFVGRASPPADVVAAWRPETTSNTITVVLNWQEELKQRVPTR